MCLKYRDLTIILYALRELLNLLWCIVRWNITAFKKKILILTHWPNRTLGGKNNTMFNCAWRKVFDYKLRVWLCKEATRQELIILTTMPNCSDSTSSSYSPFSSARALSSFCSGKFLIRFWKWKGTYTRTQKVLMQFLFPAFVRIKIKNAWQLSQKQRRNKSKKLDGSFFSHFILLNSISN